MSEQHYILEKDQQQDDQNDDQQQDDQNDDQQQDDIGEMMNDINTLRKGDMTQKIDTVLKHYMKFKNNSK